MLLLRSALILSSVALSTALFPASHNEIMRVKRRLQDSLNVGGLGSSSVCINDTTVAFAEDGLSQGFEAAAFDAVFQPSCSCSDESNQDELMKVVNATASDPSTLNITVFVDQVNQILGDLYGKSKYGCVNKCEVCYAEGSVCAILETDSEYSFELLPGNFTIDSLLALSGDNGLDDTSIFAQYLDTFEFNYEVCLTYTKGQSGKTCLKVEFDEEEITNFQSAGPLPCELTYNGVSCSACSIDSGSACLQATCPEDTSGSATATKSSVVVDTCEGTGLEGPYQFLKFFTSDSALGVGDLTVGSCDVDLDALGVGGNDESGDNDGSGNNDVPGDNDAPGETPSSGAPSIASMAMITVWLVALAM